MSNNEIIIGGTPVGPNHACYLIAEIGINHNGDVEIAKRLIDKAVDYGFSAVKFQKRTIDTVFTAEDLARPRESPFGDTNGDLKHGLELGAADYDEILLPITDVEFTTGQIADVAGAENLRGVLGLGFGIGTPVP